MKSFTATPNDEGVRASRFVERVTRHFPTSMLYKSFRNKRIKINGKRAAADTRIHSGDLITLYINDEFFEDNSSNQVKPDTIADCSYLPEILFEDANIILFHKPAGLLCHSDRTGDVSLAELLLAYLKQKQEFVPEKANGFRPAICNRLDRGTEGIVIAAKNYAALRDMNEIIRSGFLTKQYQCIVKGIPQNGIFTAYWKRIENRKRVLLRAHPAEGFVPIKTGISVLKTAAQYSLVKVTLYTGKTHQIRAHLAFLGHPLIGDKVYGDQTVNQQFSSCKNQILCAYKLHFHDIPQESVLNYLNEKTFLLDSPFPSCFFQNHIAKFYKN